MREGIAIGSLGVQNLNNVFLLSFTLSIGSGKLVTKEVVLGEVRERHVSIRRSIVGNSSLVLRLSIYRNSVKVLDLESVRNFHDYLEAVDYGLNSRTNNSNCFNFSFISYVLLFFIRVEQRFVLGTKSVCF